ncbi:lysine--tRNA ligase [Candidatus Woesearchaeota archaeon]|nr:lysine--tRNA ligase [Candidatus Woesearchaeota archaeon]
MSREEQIISERIKKLNELRDRKINPYPYTFAGTEHSNVITSKYHNASETPQGNTRIAGRIISMRRLGKLTFFHIQDEFGKMQVCAKEESLKNYEELKLYDVGDFAGIEGGVFKTRSGEITVYAKSVEMLCKTILPLPEKWHGLKDVESRYRQRYLDLVMNPEIKETFKKRRLIIDTIRETLNSHGYLEVETPILQPIYGGASAKPFKSHLNALNMTIYLRIANELALKRLLVGGFEKVYEFAKDFRNEDIDTSHNPEFTQIEFYEAYADYHIMMERVEEIFTNCARKLYGTLKIPFGDHTINLGTPWRRATMKDLLKEHVNIDVDKYSDEELFDLRITYNIDVEGDITRGLMIQQLFEELVEDKLVQPTFVIEHPIETTPLAKSSRITKELVERFELFIAGMEFSNAYSELNDPILQRKLLEEQAKQLRGGDEEAHPMDEDFVQAIEYGMPPTGGVGIGIDRLTMLMTNNKSIRDVILFPFMKTVQEIVNGKTKPKKNDEKRKNK